MWCELPLERHIGFLIRGDLPRVEVVRRASAHVLPLQLSKEATVDIGRCDRGHPIRDVRGLEALIAINQYRVLNGSRTIRLYIVIVMQFGGLLPGKSASNEKVLIETNRSVHFHAVVAGLISGSSDIVKQRRRRDPASLQDLVSRDTQ